MRTQEAYYRKNTFRIVTGEREEEVRRKIPAPKHYILHPGTTQGEKDLDTDIRRKSRVGWCGAMVLGWKSALNSFFCDCGNKREFAKCIKITKADAILPNSPQKNHIINGIYSKQGFCDKNKMSLGRSESGENVKEWARVSTLGVGSDGYPKEQAGRHLAAKHED